MKAYNKPITDLWKKAAMEKQLENLLTKPEWQEYFLNMLVEHMEQPIKINEQPRSPSWSDLKYNALLESDIPKFNEVTQFFTPDKFYDILKKHIKTAPKETDKPLFDTKLHTFKKDYFCEKDVFWNTQDKGKKKASEIPTKHLFFCIRMCYNSQIQPELRVDFSPPQKEHKNLWQVSPAVKHTLKCMFYQIGLRDDLTEEQLDKLTLMAKNVRLYL